MPESAPLAPPILEVNGLPPSLHQAMLSFILACAARRARGEIDVDNSMLVHVTRFTAVQQSMGVPKNRVAAAGYLRSER